VVHVHLRPREPSTESGKRHCAAMRAVCAHVHALHASFKDTRVVEWRVGAPTRHSTTRVTQGSTTREFVRLPLLFALPRPCHCMATQVLRVHVRLHVSPDTCVQYVRVDAVPVHCLNGNKSCTWEGGWCSIAHSLSPLTYAMRSIWSSPPVSICMEGLTFWFVCRGGSSRKCRTGFLLISSA